MRLERESGESGIWRLLLLLLLTLTCVSVSAVGSSCCCGGSKKLPLLRLVEAAVAVICRYCSRQWLPLGVKEEV